MTIDIYIYIFVFGISREMFWDEDECMKFELLKQNTKKMGFFQSANTLCRSFAKTTSSGAVSKIEIFLLIHRYGNSEHRVLRSGDSLCGFFSNRSRRTYRVGWHVSQAPSQDHVEFSV